MYGSSGQDDVIEGLLERPHGKVHRSDGEQRQRVDAHHDGHEQDVQQNLKK